MSEWQDIESAPRDGTWFLGHFPGQKIRAIPCHRCADLREGHAGEYFFGMYGIGALYGDNFMLWPTHWMPLPDPPVFAQVEEGS